LWLLGLLMRRFIVAGGVKLNGGLIDAIKAIVLKATCKWLSIEIKEHKNQRSRNQNAYYWSVVVPAVRAFFLEHGTQADAEEIHDFLKRKAGGLAKIIELPDGSYQAVSGSTAKLKVDEFEKYLEQCRAWAAEWGVIIPLPNEHLYGD